MPPPVPSLRRRLASLAYEALLLAALLLAAGFAFSLAADQRHALHGRTALQAFLFVVIGLYFAWCWSRGGQTLAMKTWRIRVERADGAPLGWPRALARCLAAWVWCLPALLSIRLAHLETPGAVAAVLAAGVLAWALASRLHPQRQFWHDALVGTRLVMVLPHNRPR